VAVVPDVAERRRGDFLAVQEARQADAEARCERNVFERHVEEHVDARGEVVGLAAGKVACGHDAVDLPAPRKHELARIEP
jgi:hypothetical protein